MGGGKFSLIAGCPPDKLLPGYSPNVIALNVYFSSSKNDEIKHFLENFRLS